jgi:4-amino-4-deoxy-L-arabinose transferase-like glycosyltransferase
MTEATGRRTATGLILGGIAAVAAIAYGWALTRDPLEPYYAAAVRSMATSWRDFAFGAFDPAGTLTLDKLPGAFWIQALLARAFGVQTWTLVLPQAIEGVLAVLVLYRAVRRLAGRAAGLIAVLVLAISPAVVAMDRGNIGDPLMVLLVLLAADAVVGAVSSTQGGRWRLVLAGVWVGLAFQAKMIEAWLVLPVLALAYLVAGPDGAGKRVRHTVVGGVVAGAVSLLWMVVVGLVPAGSRPWVDGSTGNSLFEQVFVYNGLGRVGEATPLQVLAGQGLALPVTSQPAGWDRLLTDAFGRDGGWLLPAALVIAIVGIVAARGRVRTDPVRAGYLLWGMWLLTFFVAFSVAAQINSYYMGALAPAMAALLGIGVSDVRRHRESFAPRTVAIVVVAG